METVGNLINDNKGLVMAAAAGLASSALMYMAQGFEPLDYPVSLDKQSIEIEPGVRVSTMCKDGELLCYHYDDAKTAYECFTRGMRVSNNGNYLGTRTGPNLEYEWISYKQTYDQAQQLGSGLLSLGMKSGDESFVGIFAANCPQWVIAKEACGMFSMVYVPLYDTLGPDACSYILNQTSMSVIVCDTTKRLETILKNADSTPNLKFVIVVEDYKGMNLDAATKHNIKVMTFQEILFLGKKSLHDPIPPSPESVVSICYTSGTTGNPKGVLLTHLNLVSNTAAVAKMLPKSLAITSEDSHISYLPLAHMFEVVVQLMITQHGGRIGFFRGDVRQLTEDMQALKPTLFATVPRLLNRIYDKVLMGVRGSKVKKFLFEMALKKKTDLLNRGVITRDSIWDKLVFKKVQNLMGGNVRISVVGSAPLSGAVLTFSRCAFGCMMIEGYGQTEATAGLTITLPHECEPGLVGPPLACNRIKLIDVPEMDYYAKDGKGEVCTQGNNIMKGYYKEPEKTKEAMEDGWLHTGDIGMWLPNGTLKIIDRRKHIFKLAQGEYLAPEKIEGIYTRSHLVAQAFVDGDSLQTYAVGVIVPDPEVVPKWAVKELGISNASMEDLCNNPTVNKAILDDIQAQGKKMGLKGFEQTKHIMLYPELFSVENGLLTPTFKSKRPALRKFFSKQIEDMYLK